MGRLRATHQSHRHGQSPQAVPTSFGGLPLRWLRQAGQGQRAPSPQGDVPPPSGRMPLERLRLAAQGLRAAVASRGVRQQQGQCRLRPRRAPPEGVAGARVHDSARGPRGRPGGRNRLQGSGGRQANLGRHRGRLGIVGRGRGLRRHTARHEVAAEPRQPPLRRRHRRPAGAPGCRCPERQTTPYCACGAARRGLVIEARVAAPPRERVPRRSAGAMRTRGPPLPPELGGRARPLAKR
mmetsp:Transcript_54756/g.151595  ORF Transcript_54756/g.151595 Transcript_54756/m.151595 type:complete len:238 (-) Transcript_54756:90-803(-)